MTGELALVAGTTAAIALVHTLTGPDHYLPFIVISKAKNWKTSKTIWFTALCGLGHVGSSIILGLIGIGLGLAVSHLEFMEGIRGSIISWLFLAFGLIYMAWGITRAVRNKPHRHFHSHGDGETHLHEHNHHKDHLHIHEKKDPVNLTPWILFTIFVFGPCEPLIPIVMYPAAKNSWSQLVFLTVLFSAITIVTMISVVLVASYGIRFVPMKFMERYSHALAGGTIFLCGIGMVFLGL
jgi:nickel/cobalt transporter (NicO) family protein